MQALPSAPQFEIAPTSLGLALILALALTFLAVMTVATVLLAVGKSIIPVQRIKSAAAMLVLIIPALLFVVYMARTSPTQVTPLRSIARPSHSDVVLRETATKAEFKTDSAGGVRTVSARTDSDASRSKLVAEVEYSAGASEIRAADRDSGRESSDDAARRDRERQRNSGSVEAVDATMNSTLQKMTSVLRVRQTSSTAPDWCGKEAVPSGDGVLISLSSQRFATLDEAERQITQQAVAYLKQFYRDEYPLTGEWTVPVWLIDQNAVNTYVGEVFDKDFGNGVSGKMYRAHLRLDINSALRKALHGSWQEQIISHRLWKLGGLLGLATLALASFAGYFRLDDLTHGQYRRRLKIAAAALISAGGLVAWRLLA